MHLEVNVYTKLEQRERDRRGICKPQARELQLKPAHHFARARLKIALVEYINNALWLPVALYLEVWEWPTKLW